MRAITRVTSLSSIVHAERVILPMGSGTHFSVIEGGEPATPPCWSITPSGPSRRLGRLPGHNAVLRSRCAGTEGSARWSFERMNELEVCGAWLGGLREDVRV
jgi:hypothetical protein